ncbi:MAG: 4'-phosphopantetheinyl transferase superfamily protein [Patescibacteria group bacterium]|nr:4'-phosphopantetheinyl transferase superfamily protein [Patescibacteria group bacterium]
MTPPAANDVDLWILDLDAVEPATFDRYPALLPPAECEQELRFRFAGGRQRYRCTRALARTVLSHYADCDPRDWIFRANNFGKPDIAEPAGLPLRFNLSHSGRLVVCAVASNAELGVDVERVRELPKAVELARRFFAPAEAAAVEAAPLEGRSREFLRYWTFKESYVKACGAGILVPLAKFCFALPHDAPPTIAFDDSESDRSESWQLAELRDGDAYQLALAVRRPRGEPLRIHVRRAVPLQETEEARHLPENPLFRWELPNSP